MNTANKNLSEAKDKWREVRRIWEYSEAFLYGPADVGGLDPAIDSWPVDLQGMKEVLQNTSIAITPELIAMNDDTRGFHLLEFLLWGESRVKKADEFSEREIEYLLAGSEDITNNAKGLYAEWKTYKNELLSAGEDSKKYPSEEAALEEIIQGMIDISDEVSSEKINNPLTGTILDDDGGVVESTGEINPDLEESRFSDNSKIDFIDNINSVEHVYLGVYKGNGKGGISDIVKSYDQTLDAKVIKAIKDSKEAIAAIKGTFREALYDDKTGIVNAQKVVNELTELLEDEIKPLIGK